jgi:TolA-binding protein
MKRLMILLSLLLCAATAQAQVFKCTTPDGKTIYSDTPCSGPVSSVEQVQGGQDYVSPQARAQAEQLNKQNVAKLEDIQREQQEDQERRKQAADMERRKAADSAAYWPTENTRSGSLLEDPDYKRQQELGGPCVKFAHGECLSYVSPAPVEQARDNRATGYDTFVGGRPPPAHGGHSRPAHGGGRTQGRMTTSHDSYGYGLSL